MGKKAVVAYGYDGDMYCVECAREAFGRRLERAGEPDQPTPYTIDEMDWMAICSECYAELPTSFGLSKRVSDNRSSRVASKEAKRD
jgi:hypothetical protein